MNSVLPALLFLVPFLASLLCVPAGWASRRIAWVIAIGALTATALLAGFAACRIAGGGTLTLHMGGWAPPLGIEWVLDGWGVVGLALVILPAWAALASARVSMETELRNREIWYFACAMVLVSGLIGMVLSADLFNLFVHMELASLSAYALVATGSKGSARAAFNYLIMGSVGATLYLLGVAFLYVATGSLNMADVARRLSEAHPRLILVSLAFIGAGLGIKMGLFPLHGWMPAAYSRASSAASNLMAPIVTKVFAFLLLRILVQIYLPLSLAGIAFMLDALCWIGVAAMLIGSILALTQNDLRRLLVYSSISQIGLAVIGIGLANREGLTGGLLHLLNDALMKGALFLAAGLVLVCFGIRTVKDLPRLRGCAPWTAASMAIAGFSLIGLPPFFGFFGKWYVLAGAIKAQQWSMAAAIVAGSIITAVYVFRILERIYFSPTSQVDHNQSEGPGIALIACSALALCILLLGLANQKIIDWFVAPGLG